MSKQSCPSCGCKFDVKDGSDELDQDSLDQDMGYEGSDDEEMKKSILDEMLGLTDEARKAQLPKKGSVSIEMMKVIPKKKK